jgi:glutamate dehydrogenase
MIRAMLKNEMRNQFDTSLLEEPLEHYFNTVPEQYLQTASGKNLYRDISTLNSLTPSNKIIVTMDCPTSKEGYFHLKFFQYDFILALSEVMPILENLGLRAISEQSFNIAHLKEASIWLSDYKIESTSLSRQKLTRFSERICQSLIQILKGNYESDKFNQLITSIGCNAHEVNIFRALGKYMYQLKAGFSEHYMQIILNKNPSVSRLLLIYFILRFKPEFASNKKRLIKIITSINHQLNAIQSVDEEKMLRLYFNLMKSAVRTNYFQNDYKEKTASCLALKFHSDVEKGLLNVTNLYEVFVYSNIFEGVYLRTAKCAMGEIEWSSHLENYREENVRQLHHQTLINASITPFAARGSFVIHEQPGMPDWHLENEIKASYQNFIRAILSITDNRVQGIQKKPERVVCYDQADSYFVITPGKNPKEFSDLANAISREEGYWLDDAFATGGSTGYDHRKSGILAKGAWESIKRHFRELGIYLGKMSPQIIGIGRPSDIVFGNVMTYSKDISLIAAFDDTHLFIDPNPDPEKSYQERLRLFNIRDSGWVDYDKQCLSEGGGVYALNDEFITLCEPVKQRFQCPESRMSPQALIQVLLKYRADLLFIAEEGIWVKGKGERLETLERASEVYRIDADELNCRAIVEAGNSGLTHLARIDYSLAGGLINADFIDGVAGLNCSDHEVNLKIAFINKIANNAISIERRNELIHAAAEEVEKLVLLESYYQALVMSFSGKHARQYFDLYQAQIKKIEAQFGLAQSLGRLPDSKVLSERKINGKGLTRPELAVILAYSKIHAKNEILASDIITNPFMKEVIKTAFPSSLHALLAQEIMHHDFANEIIATRLSNMVINRMGMTFLYRLQTETGEPFPEIIKAFVVSMKVFRLTTLNTEIEALDDTLSSEMQYQLLFHIRRLVNMSARWFLRSNRLHEDLPNLIAYYTNCIDKLIPIIPELIVGQTKKQLESNYERYFACGLSKKNSNKLAILRVLYTALNIAEVAKTHSFNLEKTANVFYTIGGSFNLVWFRDVIANDNREGYKNSMAKLTLRDEIDQLQRRLTILILQAKIQCSNEAELVTSWVEINKAIFYRWDEVIIAAQESNNSDYTMLFVALRELSTMLDHKFPTEEFHRLALYDSLTNLPNRYALSFEFDNFVKNIIRDKGYFALVFIDVDNFKQINDQYGHDVGDYVLKTCIDRIQKCTRVADLLARHGGDEFILLMNLFFNLQEITSILQRITEQFQSPVVLEDKRTLTITLSIGAALFPDDGKSLNDLIEKADEAMYIAKKNGKNQFALTEGFESQPLIVGTSITSHPRENSDAKA